MYSIYESDLRDELDKSVKENKIRAFPKTSVIIPKTKSPKDSNVKNSISPEELDLISLFINGDEEAVNYLENNLETGFIKNGTILAVIEYFLDEYINNGKIELSKALNDLENEDAKVLITTAALPKHEISYLSSTSTDNLLNATIKLEYNLKYAKDVIKKIRLRELEDKRNEMKKNPDLIFETFELSKQINELKKS